MALDPMMPLENPIDIVGRNADAGVADFETHEALCCLRGMNADDAFLGVFDSIADEIDEHLLQPHRIAADQIPACQARSQW